MLPGEGPFAGVRLSLRASRRRRGNLGAPGGARYAAACALQRPAPHRWRAAPPFLTRKLFLRGHPSDSPAGLAALHLPLSRDCHAERSEASQRLASRSGGVLAGRAASIGCCCRSAAALVNKMKGRPASDTRLRPSAARALPRTGLPRPHGRPVRARPARTSSMWAPIRSRSSGPHRIRSRAAFRTSR